MSNMQATSHADYGETRPQNSQGFHYSEYYNLPAMQLHGC